MEGKLDYSELHYLEPALARLDEAPQVGQLPSLSLEALCQALQTRWELSRVSLEVGAPEWREGTEISSELGAQATGIAITSPGLQGLLWCILGEYDLEELFAAVLKGAPFAVALKGSNFRQAVIRFLTITLLEQLEVLDFPTGVFWRFEGIALPPAEPALCYSLQLQLPARRIEARLILSKHLVQSLRQRFVVKNPLELSPQRAKLLEMDLQVVGGRVSLSQEEWQRATIGDFIALDQCSVDPDSGLGPVTLAIEGKALLTGEATAAGLKIIGQKTNGDGSHAV